MHFGKCVRSLAYLKRNCINIFSISGAHILYSAGNVEATLDLLEERCDQHVKLVVKKRSFFVNWVSIFVTWNTKIGP